MGRLLVIVVPGYPHHITERGDRSMEVCHAKDDRPGPEQGTTPGAEQAPPAKKGYVPRKRVKRRNDLDLTTCPSMT